MSYETERAALDAEYNAAHAAALEALSAVVNEFNRRKVALLQKYSVKNAAVEAIEQGRDVSLTSYPDGSYYYEVDGSSYDYDSDDGGAMASAIQEAIDLDLIVEDVSRYDPYTDWYKLPAPESTVSP